MPHPPAGRTRRARAVHPLLALVTLAALLGLPRAALGHAELDSITPADQSTVATPPSSIVAVFTEQLDPAKSSLTLVDASGKVIAQGGALDPNQTLTLSVDPSTMGAGVYTVRWSSASAEDGDLDRGTTTFTVSAAAPSPSPSPASSQPASAGPSTSPPAISSGVPSPAPSATPTTPTASTTDVLIPIVVALIVLLAIGVWLLRGRGRGPR